MNKTEVKIPEMLFFQEGPGVRNTQYTSSGVKLLNVANLVDGKVDLSTSYRYISEDEAYGKYRHFLCDEGDFIVASSGIKVDYIDKKMGFISREMLPLCMNTSTIRFKVLDGSKLNIKYFMYFLKSTAFKKQLAKQITGSAQLNYGPSHLKQMTFPLIDIKIQNDLVQKLDSIMRIIDQKNASLKKLDELVKARFVEMFDCDYEEVELSELGKISTGSTPPMKNKDFYENADMPFYKPGDFIDGVSNIDCSESFIDARAESVSRIMDSGTVAVTCIGIIGKIGIIKRRGICNQQINFIVPNDKVNSIYLAYAIDTKKKFMQEKANAPVVPILNKTNFSKVTIPLAPVELQNQFATFVAKLDKSKFALVKSIKLLKKSPFDILLGPL